MSKPNIYFDSINIIIPISKDEFMKTYIQANYMKEGIHTNIFPLNNPITNKSINKVTIIQIPINKGGKNLKVVLISFKGMKSYTDSIYNQYLMLLRDIFTQYKDVRFSRLDISFDFMKTDYSTLKVDNATPYLTTSYFNFNSRDYFEALIYDKSLKALYPYPITRLEISLRANLLRSLYFQDINSISDNEIDKLVKYVLKKDIHFILNKKDYKLDGKKLKEQLQYLLDYITSKSNMLTDKCEHQRVIEEIVLQKQHVIESLLTYPKSQKYLKHTYNPDSPPISFKDFNINKIKKEKDTSDDDRLIKVIITNFFKKKEIQIRNDEEQKYNNPYMLDTIDLHTKYKQSQANITISKNQYLSDIKNQLKFLKGVNLLKAPPGIGKNHYVMNEYKSDAKIIILLVPLTSILINMKALYKDVNASYLYADNHEIDKNANIIVAVYDKYESIAAQIDITHCDIFIDEAHNMYSAYTYRKSALNSLYKLVYEMNAKRLILMSGTFLDHIMGFEFDAIFNIVVDDIKNKKCTVIQTMAALTELKEALQKSSMLEKKHIIFYNNKIAQIKLKESLEKIGYKCIILNRDSLDNSDVKTLLEASTLKDNNVVITSSIGEEGINIYDIINHVHVLDMQASSTLEQLVNRARKNEPNLTVYKDLSDKKGKWFYTKTFDDIIREDNDEYEELPLYKRNAIINDILYEKHTLNETIFPKYFQYSMESFGWTVTFEKE